MTQTENLVKRLPNDIGGLQADRIERTEHELEPWEKRCHTLVDVLDFHKILNTEEKRRGVEALGSEMVGKLSYYERWVAADAVADVVEIGWWRSLWFVQRTISGVSALVETTPWNRIARRQMRTARCCLRARPGLTRSRRASGSGCAGSSRSCWSRN